MNEDVFWAVGNVGNVFYVELELYKVCWLLKESWMVSPIKAMDYLKLRFRGFEWLGDVSLQF